jgi:hypothetical protein
MTQLGSVTMETRTVHISDPLAEGFHWHFQAGQPVRVPNSDICCACLSRRSIDDAVKNINFAFTQLPTVSKFHHANGRW